MMRSSRMLYNAWNNINKDEPSISRKCDIEDGVKLVAIIAISDFTKDYLIKQKIIPNNI